MISVCIPYIHSDTVWNELIFTVRSIEKNLKVPHKIFLVGDSHPALNIPVIPAVQLKGKHFSKVADSYMKMEAIIMNPEVSECFIYTYDDIVMMNPVTMDFFNTSYCVNNLASITRGNSIYKLLQQETLFLLKKNGLPTWNMETHMPKMFNKKSMRHLIDRFITTDSHILLNSLYFNYCFNELPVELSLNDHIKAGFYGCSSPYSFGNNINYSVACKNKLFINYNNKGLTESLKKYIISNFKERSSYEKK